MLLVDTGVIVAAADRTDTHHRACADLLQNFDGPLITSPLVIAEATYLINRIATSRILAEITFRHLTATVTATATRTHDRRVIA